MTTAESKIPGAAAGPGIDGMTGDEFLARCGLRPGEGHQHEYEIGDDGRPRKVATTIVLTDDEDGHAGYGLGATLI